MPDSEVRTFLERHLQSIFDGNVDTYHATTVPELTLYEWYVVPQRIEGIPFHDFQMTEAERIGATPLVHASRDPAAAQPHHRFDLANYSEQRYGDTAIACYTMLISENDGSGVVVRSYNESRIMVKFPDGWRIVHVHKSPSWSAPFQPPKSG